MATITDDTTGSFSLKFDTDDHDIDSATLGHVLVSISALFNIANSEFNDGAKLDMRVKATQQGSFVADLSLLLISAPGIAAPLLNAENFRTVTELSSTVFEWIKLKKELGSDPVTKLDKSGDRYIIRDSPNSSQFNINTVNLYVNRPEIPREASRVGAALEMNENIKGVQMATDNPDASLSIERKGFARLAAQSEDFTEETPSQVLTKRAGLKIISIAFENDLKSRFLYQGVRIAANITDLDFYVRIDDGETFQKGDSLEVEMSIGRVWNPSFNGFIDKNYEISKVLNHIPRSVNRQLELPERDLG
jgi:hypothetical protein